MHRLNQTVDVTVYKLTVANTVEERILALQEKKRALAQAAVEGKAVGKLSIKDILNLFRRDAEADDHHNIQTGGVGGGVGLGLGEKTRVLSPGEDQRNINNGIGGSGGGGGVGALRASPPVMEKGRRAQPRDEGVWGRRW